MNVTYRRATIEDIEILAELRIKFLAEHFNPAGESEYDALKKELRKYFTENIPSGALIAWLAASDRKVVATAGMVVWRIPANNSMKNGKLGYILNMYTLPEARGQGICTALLEKLIDDPKSLGLNRVHLHASKMGEPIYRKRGFREPGDVELVLRID